jgi:hypothetical protein
MSLAMYAAPFNDNSNNNNNNDDIIHKKRIHNKTQKRVNRENFDNEKVNSVLEKIHNDKNDDEENDMGDFNPPPKPESMGTQKRIATEEMETMMNSKNQNMSLLLGNAPSPNIDNTDLDLNNYTKNYGDERSNKEYYKKLIGNYMQMNPQMENQNNTANRRYYGNPSNINVMNNDLNNDLLMQKLNYMINLLEEQQDEKTNNVTEEVILYSFLGIFIIFIADSFAKVGKYVR